MEVFAKGQKTKDLQWSILPQLHHKDDDNRYCANPQFIT
jgi:hypothetical protein